MEDRRIFSLILISLFLFLIAEAQLFSSRNLLGIAPQDGVYYATEAIRCKDGSKEFSKAQLNDEFCDCADGTDEPGTSACPEGKFYCQNTAHIPLVIFASRVNDGICDCCDGSDEYNGRINCTDTCWEAGKIAREKLEKKIKTYRDGANFRKQEIQKASQAFFGDEAELSKLKDDEKTLDDLVQKLREQKECIEKKELEERLRNEEEGKKLAETERETSIQQKLLQDLKNEKHEEYNIDLTGNVIENVRTSSNLQSEGEFELVNDVEGGLADRHSSELNLADDLSEMKIKAEDDDDSNHSELFQEEGHDATESLSREELGRLVASRWTGQTSMDEDQDRDLSGSSQDDSGEFALKDEVAIHDFDNGNAADDDADVDYEDAASDDDDEFEDDVNDEYSHNIGPDESYNSGTYETSSDFSGSGDLAWLYNLQQTVQNVLQSFNFFRTPLNISEGDHVRKEYNDLSSKLAKLRSRISNLDDKLKLDFGQEKEFYLFYDHCFEKKRNRYTYKVCPFKQASQVEGHSTTRLGKWDKFEDSYRLMQFSHGDRCWNGPARSMKVLVRCGLNNELTDVDEPSRCEYAALLSTPAVCYEEKLKELEQQLESMHVGAPIIIHDEL